jgi:hypothetical protein
VYEAVCEVPSVRPLRKRLFLAAEEPRAMKAHRRSAAASAVENADIDPFVVVVCQRDSSPRIGRRVEPDRPVCECADLAFRLELLVADRPPHSFDEGVGALLRPALVVTPSCRPDRNPQAALLKPSTRAG